MENFQPWLEVLLQKNQEQNSIAKILSVDSKPATSKGDNYMSEIKRVKIEVLLKSGKKTKKSVIIKGLPSTEYHQGIMKECSIFIREIVMYRDVISSMEDILKEYGDYTEPMWPQMIDYRANDLLVMNDLAELGYKMGNRKEGLDLEHCLLVVISLAKFHATSVIVKERGFIPLDLFEKHVFKIESSKEMFEQFYNQSLNNIIKNIESDWEPEWKPIAEKIRVNILPKVYDIVLGGLSYDPNRFNVMNHGDCWVNNMLFKYSIDAVRPISIKFVDLQLSFYNSPVYDLQYFLSTSLTMDVRNNSLDHLLTVYHDTLVKQLQLYNYEGTIITYEQLIKEFKEANIFGLMTALSLLPYVYRDETDESFPEMEDMLKEMKDEGKFETMPGCNSPLFIAVMKEILSRIDKDNSLS
ncbi:hypothetical protein O3M35_001078 [Rhynocoris fuscipes]|uniref:CHK kinase-like domain-containing protein n=1 Tax=Rhynocoris fuscipes TaxID=488301 RepID=A0AAW1DNZ3_9HEMI